MSLSVLLPLLALFAASDLVQAATAHDKRLFDATFDYVIVGGGTGGLALANRLAADGSASVAVVEAGSYYQASNILMSSTPAGDVLWAGGSPSDVNPLVDWGFITQPQADAEGRKVHYARGKCLGGSSARNFMIYQRPDKGSMSAWAEAVGDASYTWDAMEPYFKRSVQFTPPRSPPRFSNSTANYRAEAFDPSGGPLRVSYPAYASPMTSWLLGGLAEVGVPPAQDFNSGELYGAAFCASTINAKNGKRDSSQTSFLDSARNVHMYNLRMAKKILFDGTRATGVQLNLGTKLTARREVILAAGAFQSPQLLMVSGIGPAPLLASLNIPLVADRPGVGQNLTDHIFVSPSYRVNVMTFTKLANDLLYIAWEYATNFLLFAKGVLTNPVADMISFERFKPGQIPQESLDELNKLPASWPHVEYLSAPGYIGQFNSLLTEQPKDGYQYASMLAALAAPLSRGTVSIRSADTDDAPLIDPKWLSHPVDQAVAVAGYKRVRAVFASAFTKRILAHPDEYYPGKQVQSDEDILAVIKHTVMTVWHAACTCRMGRRDDPTAVVDSKARVIGVERLRVVDASAFALLPPGHPQSVVYALAEKIADDIKAAWSGPAPWAEVIAPAAQTAAPAPASASTIGDENGVSSATAGDF